MDAIHVLSVVHDSQRPDDFKKIEIQGQLKLELSERSIPLFPTVSCYEGGRAQDPSAW